MAMGGYQQRASPGVKAFGEMLKSDHSANNMAALDVAAKTGLVAPTEPLKGSKALHERLSRLNGAAFDEDFAKAMVADHKKDIAEFTEASYSKGATVFTGYAKDTLPHLREHLKFAQALR
jgi:putative membrane protein